MLKGITAGAMVLLVVGCGSEREYVDDYEQGVYGEEPVYCYATLADPMCYRAPLGGEFSRLISYYGPHPIRYPPFIQPPPEPEPPLAAPPAVDCYVVDRAPVGGAPGGTVEVCQNIH